jgi:hypothetical protein
MHRLMRPSETAWRVRGYFGGCFRRALENGNETELGDALAELMGLIIEEAVIGRWQLPRPSESLSRITEPL